MKDRTDPEYIGPGVWVSIHIESSEARDKESQEMFCKNIRKICQNFPCLECSKHCKEYINNNPPEKFMGIKMKVDGKNEMIGLSVWSWNFHNTVNVRLGKKLMDWETYYGIYIKNNKECSKKCSLTKQ